MRGIAKDMDLTDRKKKILQYVIDDYIQTAVPVSSKSITENHLTSISSATVRSELSTLEELGYLMQPHTSAGRIPSNEAYKLYVNELMTKEALSQSELDYIEEIFTSKSKNIEEIIKSVAKVVSELTAYTSIAYTQRDREEILRSIKIIRLRPTQALLLIVTDTKLLKDSIIEIPEEMSDQSIDQANQLLENLFANKSFEEICYIDISKIENDFNEYKTLFLKVINALKEYLSHNSDVVLEGEHKILSHPESSDIETVKNLMKVVTEKDKLVELTSKDGSDVKINIKIGTDGYDGVPEDCSIVTATYSAGGVKLGTYGVIGPTRMDYKKVISVLEYVGKILESIISKW